MQLAKRSVARRAYDERRLRALELYLEQGGGRETYASIAAELEVSERTVSTWFTDDDLLDMVDQLVPLWPAIGHARMQASKHAERMLQHIVDLADGKMERARAADRLKAAQFVLAIAGVRPVEKDERQSDGGDTNQSAIVVSVNIGGVPAPEPVDVIDGQSWADSNDQTWVMLNGYT